MMTSLPPSVPPQSIDDAVEIESREAISPSRLWRFHDEYVLGTRLTVLVNTRSRLIAREAAIAARREIDRLDRVFNVRYEDSEISLLNHLRIANASPELFAVAELSEQWRAITRGAFDGRMGELLRLWADATRDQDSPDRESIERSLAALNSSTVSLDPVNRRIALSSSASLSLDAIAKGYIVDAAVNAARRAAPTMEGLAVCIGGDIRCWGASPGHRGWRVGIPDSRNPADNAPLIDAVLLTNAASMSIEASNSTSDANDSRSRSRACRARAD
jgi:FAD:protein FMN transferase